MKHSHQQKLERWRDDSSFISRRSDHARQVRFMVKKHGSWLNVQELEWSVLARQALRERVGDVVALMIVADRWVADRRARAVRIDWQFRSADAQIKLKRLYPVFTV
jgi:hypothetical protein